MNKFHRLFGRPPRQPETLLTQREMNLARSVQEVIAEAMLRLARHVRRGSGERNLCLAGGVAVNCVGNGKILQERIFERVWIQPAAGDAGSALGAALGAYYRYVDQPRIVQGQQDLQQSSLLGPSFSQFDIKSFLSNQSV